MNTEKENAFDEAYKKEFDMLVHVAEQIAGITGLSFSEAKAIVISKRKEAISILS